jgi:hypothetical protein
MRLSSMADYAVVTMAAAARHCGGVRVNAAQLAEETDSAKAGEPVDCGGLVALIARGWRWLEAGQACGGDFSG